MTTPTKSDRTLLPLLVTSMAVISPLLFILGLVVGNHLTGNESLTQDSISSWLSAIATVAIAVLTFILAKETWYLREAQILQLEELKRENIRPNIGIQLDSNPAGISFINATISNSGKGIAKRVRFNFLDRNGKPIEPGLDPVVDSFYKLSMFKKGIETVGINQRISSFVFSFYELGGKLEGKIFEPFLSISISFEDSTGAIYQNSVEIDFAQYEGVSHLGGADASYKTAEELKKIRELLARVIKTSRNRLEVDIFSEADRKDAEEFIRKRLEELRAKDSNKAA